MPQVGLIGWVFMEVVQPERLYSTDRLSTSCGSACQQASASTRLSKTRRWAIVQLKEGSTGSIRAIRMRLTLASRTLVSSGCRRQGAATLPEDTAAFAWSYPGTLTRRGELNSPTVRRIQHRLNQIRIATLLEDGASAKQQKTPSIVPGALYGCPRERAGNRWGSRGENLGRSLRCRGHYSAGPWGRRSGHPLASSSKPPPLRLVSVKNLWGPIAVRRWTSTSGQLGLIHLAATIRGASASFSGSLRKPRRGSATFVLPRTAGVHALWDLRGQGAIQVLSPGAISEGSLLPGMIF